MAATKVNETQSVHKLRTIGIDILGVLLIIASILFGWIPGPGGIPLFIAGLSLLATNHKWARNLLERVKIQGLRAANVFFREHKLLMATYDIFTVLLLAAATAMLIQSSGNILRSLSVVMIFVGMGLFLGNRKRLQRLQRLAQRKKG